MFTLVSVGPGFDMYSSGLFTVAFSLSPFGVAFITLYKHVNIEEKHNKKHSKFQ